MLSISGKVTINAPSEKLFSAASDPLEQLKWDPGTMLEVEKISPGPLSAGAKYRGRFKGFGVMEYEFAQFRRNEIFSHDAAIKMGKIHHAFELKPVPGGTELTQTLHVERNFLGLLLTPMMKRMLKKRIAEINGELKAYVEK